VGGFSGAFILTTSVILAYVLGWIPYSSDYTRYLCHADEAPEVKRRVFAYALSGSLLSTIWIEGWAR